MRSLVYIALFISLTASAQKMETNAPDLVYPILEEFISENFKNDQRSLEKLFHLDSIMIRNLPLVVDGPFIRKLFGTHYRSGSSNWIEIDSSLIDYPKEFNRTLRHELGHMYGLKHIKTQNLKTDDPLRLEIMSDEHHHIYLSYKYADPEIWEQINKNYYNSLKTPLK